MRDTGEIGCVINMWGGDRPCLCITVGATYICAWFDRLVHGRPGPAAEWHPWPTAVDEFDPEEFPDRRLEPYTRVLSLDDDRQITILDIDINGLRLVYKQKGLNGDNLTLKLEPEEAVALAAAIDEAVAASGPREVDTRDVPLYGSCAVFPVECQVVERREDRD